MGGLERHVRRQCSVVAVIHDVDTIGTHDNLKLNRLPHLAETTMRIATTGVFLMRRSLQAGLLALAMNASCANADEPPKVAYRIVCSDPVASQLISDAVRTRIDAAKLQTTDKLPFKKLFIYAQQDVGDRVNANGWSFAIAHVSNQVTYFVASKLLPANGSEVNEVKTALTSMLQEEGFLTYMNVAHVDRLNATTISEVADNFVAEFVKRLPK
jgi:hypothetical protein